MIIQKSKKYRRILNLISLAIVFISIGVTKVYADSWNGSGVSYSGCKGANCECNQGDSQLCLWDNKNHVLLKVSLYYFPNASNLGGGIELGHEIYGAGNASNYAGYFSGKTIRPLSGFPSDMNSGISGPAKSFFYYNTSNFYLLFNYITGVSVTTQAELKQWMTSYCANNGYGNTLALCHQDIPGTKGFRIVIQPILTGIYGDSNSVRVATVKTMFGSYDIWNSSSTKRAASAYMYLDQTDVGISAGSSGGSTDGAEVSDGASGYGLNMFSWPVDSTATPCNPTTDGVNTCCTLYGIKNATDAANNDSTKITIPMTQAQLNAAGCNGTTPVDTSCSYTITKNIPSTCGNSTSGLVQDKATWKCVLSSTLSNRDITVQNHYYTGFSNRYCAVYCQEKIEYSFPGTGAYSDAGTYFTIDSYSAFQKIGPISYKGTTTCRVTSKASSEDGIINVAKFVAEFKAADYAVLVAFDNWQYGELQNEVINAAVSQSVHKVCEKTWCEETVPLVCSCTILTSPLCVNGIMECGSYCKTHGSCREEWDGIYWKYNNKFYSGTTFSRSTGFSDGTCECDSGEKTCSHTCKEKETLKDVGALKGAYEAAVEYRAYLLAELKKCNNYYKTYNEFKPNVTFTYQDILYKGTYTLKAVGSASSYTEYFKTGNSTGTKNSSASIYNNSVNSDASSESASSNTNSTAVRGYSSKINYYECGHSVTKKGCTLIKQYDYPINAWYEQTTKRSYTYTLPDNLYQYIDKPSGYSSGSSSTNYEHLSFSNLPVHYSTKPGDYDYYITTTTYGNGDKFNQYIIGNKNFNQVSYHTDTKYSCTYRINEKKTIICTEGTGDSACSDDTGGTDLIYRAISLYYPFPGQNATTNNLRSAGSNWSSNSDAISKYIYNNRGVSYYELYNLSPMYELTLTPALMRKIKEYNNTQDNTKIWYYKGTSMQVNAVAGYSDFTLSCKTNADGSKSEKCTSQVIRTWGVKGCAISGSGYTNCGNTEAW